MVTFKQIEHNDWPQVKSIYLEGIATGHATFQQTAPKWEEWDKGHLSHSRIASISNGDISGWGALTPVSSRPVYIGVAEVSVYVGEKYKGIGLGYQLLQKVVAESEQNGIWTLQASIFPENVASLRIHEKNGFRILGIRERIGQMNGLWRNTVIMERRSKIIGI